MATQGYQFRRTATWGVICLILSAGVAAIARTQDDPEPVFCETLTGKVVDESGNPLPGVNVTVNGTVIGTTTNSNGEFTMTNVNVSTLTFSFIGYETIELGVLCSCSMGEVVMKEAVE